MSDQQQKEVEFDPELVALADTGNDSILKPILMLVVILLGFWVIGDWQEELAYFMQSGDPVEMGDAIEMASGDVEIPHNQYVSISGVPSRRSQSERYRFFTLIGTDIFVEQKRDDYIEDPLERELKGNQGDVDRTRFRGTGRILHFSQMPDRYGGLRNYYQQRYRLRFCELLNDVEKKDLRQRQRDGIVQQYQINYDKASSEERARKQLTRVPTEEQIKAIVDSEPICVDAYLLQADVAPKDHLWYLLASIVFALFMIFNAVALVRWVRRFLK